MSEYKAFANQFFANDSWPNVFLNKMSDTVNILDMNISDNSLGEQESDSNPHSWKNIPAYCLDFNDTLKCFKHTLLLQILHTDFENPDFNFDKYAWNK